MTWMVDGSSLGTTSSEQTMAWPLRVGDAPHRGARRGRTARRSRGGGQVNDRSRYFAARRWDPHRPRGPPGSVSPRAPHSSATRTTPTSVSGSRGVTPNSCVLSTLASVVEAIKPSHNPDGQRPERLAQDEQDDVASRGAERHADADLLRAPRNEVRHDAVDADGREHEADRRRAASTGRC